MNWDEEAEEAAQPFGDCRSHDMRFVHGAQWQRDQLRTPEAIERGARALNENGWTCLDCNNEPGDYDQCKDCQEVCRNAFKSSLNALLGED